MVKAKGKKLKSKKTKGKKMTVKKVSLPKKNIETKIDAKTGKASGNLIKNNPSASNNSSVLARPQRNIEIKIDPKTGKASGNLFKRDPIVSNNPTVKVGKTLSGKIDFSQNKKNGLSVKSGQQVSEKLQNQINQTIYKKQNKLNLNKEIINFSSLIKLIHC